MQWAPDPHPHPPNLYCDIPSIQVERLPSSFPQYVFMAIRKELYYCCIDFKLTVQRCFPLIWPGMPLGCGLIVGAAAASARKSYSLWIPARAYFLGVSLPVFIFQAMKLMVRWARLTGDMKTQRQAPPSSIIMPVARVASMHLLNTFWYSSLCHHLWLPVMYCRSRSLFIFW